MSPANAVHVACPGCQTVEQYVRARTLYEASTSETQGHSGGRASVGLVGLTPMVAWTSGAPYRGTQQSLLTRRVAPPAMPAWMSRPVRAVLFVMWALLGLYLPLALYFVFLAPRGPHFLAGAAALAGIYLAGIAVTVVLLVYRSRRYGSDITKWWADVEEWDRRWICLRCGTTAREEVIA